MKKRKVEVGRTYVGIVEDNKDPKKEGRLKLRVLDIYDESPVEDLPWASPWKDLGGGQISIPEKGKVVIVVFEQGHAYKPEYISTEHWNVNLENKLKGLSDSDYLSFKSLIFDHNTQIYSSDSEGLKLDYKFNNINIKQNGINLNLKDNTGLVNIGDATANQQAILGNHFLDWFDEFVDALLNNTAFLGNAGAPVLANPGLINTLVKYKSQKAPMFLSHHVNMVDNDKVSSVKAEKREETPQLGDTWNSTKTQNNLTTNTGETNKPVEGEKPKYDENHAEPQTDKPGVSPQIPASTQSIPKLPPKNDIQSNKKVEKVVWFLKSKNYQYFEEKNILNIVAFRDKKTVAEGEVTNITNLFDEELCVFYKNENGVWENFEYNITTVPGFEPGTTNLPKNVSILRQGQYLNQLKMIDYQGDSKHKCLSFDNCAVHRNDSITRYNFESPTEIGNFAITIHRSSDINTSEYVYNYSTGAQVFKNFNQYEQFINLCQKQITAGNSAFTYTLCSKKEFNDYLNPDEQREIAKSLPKEQPVIQQSIAPTQSGTQSTTTPDNDLKLKSKNKMNVFIKQEFFSEPNKPTISYFNNKPQTNNFFRTDKIISFGEGIGKESLRKLRESKATEGITSVSDLVKKFLFPRLKKELLRHITYLIRNDKLKKEDYFHIDENGEIKNEKGLIIWRYSISVTPENLAEAKKNAPEFIHICNESYFKTLTREYTNIWDKKENKLTPDKPSSNSSWVIEQDNEPPVAFLEAKFVPFDK